MENISFIISLIVLVVLLFLGVKIAPRHEYYEDYFSLDVSKGIQGLLAVCIIFHHCSVWFNLNGSTNNFFIHYFYFPALMVSFFFFCSGYGLYYSLKNKKNYLKGFVQKRILTVLVPFFICNYIYMFVSQLEGRQYTVKEIVLSFFGFLLINGQMWFAIEIMILYLIFYFLFKYIKSENVALILMGLCILIMIYISMNLGHSRLRYYMDWWFHGEWWYNTTLCFFVGMVFSKFKDKITSIFKRFYWVLLTVCTIAFLYLAKINCILIDLEIYSTETRFSMRIQDKLLGLSAQSIMVFFYIMVLMLIMMKVRFHNKALAFCGRISLEIILINYLYITLFDRIRSEYGIGIYLVLVVVFTIISAIVLNKIKLIILEKDKKGTHLF